jgi:hypothetical protein
MSAHAYCICTTVGSKALQSLLEASGRGRYRDTQPWLVAKELVAAAAEHNEQVPIVFAAGQPSEFSHWGFLESIEVHELHRGQWESHCAFTKLEPVNVIWSSLDSVFLKPGNDQLRREALEQIHQHRYPLTEGEIHPYAICETPAFILAAEQQS